MPHRPSRELRHSWQTLQMAVGGQAVGEFRQAAEVVGVPVTWAGVGPSAFETEGGRVCCDERGRSHSGTAGLVGVRSARAADGFPATSIVPSRSRRRAVAAGRSGRSWRPTITMNEPTIGRLRRRGIAARMSSSAAGSTSTSTADEPVTWVLERSGSRSPVTSHYDTAESSTRGATTRSLPSSAATHPRSGRARMLPWRMHGTWGSGLLPARCPSSAVDLSARRRAGARPSSAVRRGS